MKKLYPYCALVGLFLSIYAFLPNENDILIQDPLQSCKKNLSISIIVPAYNEENRITPMLTSYCDYFKDNSVHFTVVLNGITDNTKAVVEDIQKEYPDRITIIESAKGKGAAIKAGFVHSLDKEYDYIGFVDADGATAADQYDKLIQELTAQTDTYDGIIASRYMKDSDLGAPRPFIKEWGRKLFYNRRIEKTLHLHYTDYQCGAKLFKGTVMHKIAPLITESGWAIDLDILYLCKQHNFTIKETPIRWRDAPGSHLSIIQSTKDLYRAVNRIKCKSNTPSATAKKG